MIDAQFFFGLSLFLYLAGAVLGALWCLRPRRSYYVSHLLALAAGISGITSSVPVLLGQSPYHITIPWLTALSNVAPSIKLFENFSLQVDALSAFFVFVISLLVVPVSIYAFGYLREYEHKQSVALLGVLYNLFILSMVLVVTANNALFFLIVWEVMSVVSYFLVTFDHEKTENTQAGFLYIVMTHVGTAFIVLFFLIFYQQAGSFDFEAFRKVAANLPDLAKTLLFVFALIGFGTKAGLVPLHIWLPYAHPAAPSHISALMSGVMIKTAVYGMLRIFFDFLKPDLVWWWGLVLLGLASLSAILGILYAVTEKDLKKLLAYSSVENMGIILIGVSLAMIFSSYQTSTFAILAAVALIAGLYHLLNHAVFKSVLFLGAGAVVSQTHTRNIEALGGLIKKMPWTAACFLIGSIAISALPPFNGFISEWLTFQALLLGFNVPDLIVKIIVPLSAALLALGAALATACFVKAFGVSFLALPRSEHVQTAQEVSSSMKWAMGSLAALCLVLGILPTAVVRLLDGVTGALVGASAAASMGVNPLTLAVPSAKIVTVAPLGLALILLIVIPVALGVAYMAGELRTRRAQTWGCGLPKLSPRMEYTATGFSKPIQLIFKSIYQPRKEIEIETDVSSYVHKRIRYELQIESPFEKYFYQPVSAFVLKISAIVRRIQTGSINTYLAYIFIALVILLLLVR
ncbi:hydrogenase 4 subunit B [Candidatus Acetothermia bacterium]|nr:hydrogenase 4 subunit B [Candidatus Acetothermia bacterium]MBI3660675.1 hydrogenase 4 subunit B [Candidatus Acetothermia bacterium]